MEPRVIARTIDLAQDGQREPGWGQRLMLVGAALADRLELSVYNAGARVDLTGLSGLAYFKTTAGDIPWACEVGGHLVAVEFPLEAYAFEGTLVVQVFLSDGTRNVPLYQEAFDIGEGRSDVLIDPGDIVPDLSAILGMLSEMSASKTACDEATGKASRAAQEASAAATASAAAVERANAAAGAVEATVSEADAALQTAREAASTASAAAAQVEGAVSDANSSAADATAAAEAANAAASEASTQAGTALAAAQTANTAADTANAAAADAATAAAGAATAANEANAARDRLEAISLSVETLPAEADATGELTKTDSALVIALGVPRGPQGPQGPKGDQGEPGSIDNLPYATTAPLGAGTASAGSTQTVARGDHVHPEQTSVSGNAGTATKLQTAWKIGNASFDGSADISLEQMGAYAAGGIRTAPLSLPVSAWTGSGPYTATIARADVTAGTWVHLALDAASMGNYPAAIEWSTETPGQIVLTTAVQPTGALAGQLVLMEVN